MKSRDSERASLPINRENFRQVVAESLGFALEDIPDELGVTTLASIAKDGLDCVMLTMSCEDEFGLVIEEEAMERVIYYPGYDRYRDTRDDVPLNPDTTLSDFLELVLRSAKIERSS